jgi:TonB family protein
MRLLDISHFRRVSALLAIASALAVAVQFPAIAQTEPGPGCLRIHGSETLGDRTLAVGLAVKLATASPAGRIVGKLHLYTSTTSYTVNIQATPSSLIVTPDAGGTADPQLHLVAPVVVKLDTDVSQIKGLILETSAPPAACRMSEALVYPWRATGLIKTDLLAVAHSIEPIIAPPAKRITLECPVEFAFPHVLRAAQLNLASTDTRISGQVQVLVDLDAGGRVINAKIKKSLSVPLDAIALQAAQETTYAPEIVACVSQPSSYIFAVVFQN